MGGKETLKNHIEEIYFGAEGFKGGFAKVDLKGLLDFFSAFIKERNDGIQLREPPFNGACDAIFECLPKLRIHGLHLRLLLILLILLLLLLLLLSTNRMKKKKWTFCCSLSCSVSVSFQNH